MTTRSRPRWRAAVAAAAAVMLTAGSATAAHAAEPLVLDHGHIDAFNVTVTDGELLLSLAEDVTGSHVLHQPEDVLLKVKEEAWNDGIPSGFPGSPEGYVLPLTQDRNLIWPGWDTGGVAGSGYTDVSIDITDVDGPGDIHLYTLTGFGTPASLLQDGGYQLPGTIREERPAHTHAQWTFSAAGEYSLEVRATATNPDTGAKLSSNAASYSFSVGDGEEPPAAPTSLAINGLAHHYHTGDAVELTAVPDATTDWDHYHWYTRDNASDSWNVVPGQGGATYSGVADHDGRQIKAALFDDEHTVVAESAPVTVHIDDHDDHDDGPAVTELTVAGAEGHFHSGDTVELTAVQDPDTGLDHYHWYTRPDADSDWALAGDAGSSGAYSFTAVPEIDGYQVQARLFDDEHEVVAESTPVTIRVDDHDRNGHGSPDHGGDEDRRDDGGHGRQVAGGTDGGDAMTPNGSSDPVCVPFETEVEREVPIADGFDLVLDHGHIDAFNVVDENGSLSLDLKEDVTGSHVRHDPSEVLLHVKPDAYTEDIPSGFPGAPAGYLLPLTQDPNLIWPGWDTGGVAGGDHTDVSIEVGEITGPGEVFLYTTSTFGGAVPILEDGGFELPGTIRESSPAHTHAQWTFSEPGEYTLTARATATDPSDGSEISSDSATYTFAVDTLPDVSGATTETVSETVTVGRTADGEECDLSGGTGVDAASAQAGSLATTGGTNAAALALVGASLLSGGAAATAMRRRFLARAD